MAFSHPTDSLQESLPNLDSDIEPAVTPLQNGTDNGHQIDNAEVDRPMYLRAATTYNMEAVAHYTMWIGLGATD